MGEVWMGHWEGGWAGRGGRWGKRPGKQGQSGEEALEGDGRVECPFQGAFSFSNKEKHIPLGLVCITRCLETDLQTGQLQEEAALDSRNSLGRYGRAWPLRHCRASSAPRRGGSEQRGGL